MIADIPVNLKEKQMYEQEMIRPAVTNQEQTDPLQARLDDVVKMCKKLKELYKRGVVQDTGDVINCIRATAEGTIDKMERKCN